MRESHWDEATIAAMCYIHSPERMYMTDEENWIEGSVGEFLESIGPFLEARGVSALITEEQIGKGNGYSLKVNGELLVLYTEHELARTRGQETLARTSERINQLLLESGAPERTYCLYGWNELIVVFLTPEKFTELRAMPLVREHLNLYDPTLPVQ